MTRAVSYIHAWVLTNKRQSSSRSCVCLHYFDGPILKRLELPSMVHSPSYNNTTHKSFFFYYCNNVRSVEGRGQGWLVETRVIYCLKIHKQFAHSAPLLLFNSHGCLRYQSLCLKGCNARYQRVIHALVSFMRWSHCRGEWSEQRVNSRPRR